MRENLQVMRRHYEALNERDFETARACYAADTVWDDRDIRPDGAIHRGREAMATETGRWFGTWKEYRFEVESMLEVEDRVLIVGRERGIGKTSGVEINQLVGLVITFRDGLIVETKVFRDPDQARAAVGL
jgi:ketosteroid isomerase-like protein